jgi:hypothetical protein
MNLIVDLVFKKQVARRNEQTCSRGDERPKPYDVPLGNRVRTIGNIYRWTSHPCSAKNIILPDSLPHTLTISQL